ncbi:hypothetical protein [Cellulomonas sp. P5_E12]
MFRYEPDPRVGDWLSPRLGPFGASVGSLVPRGFESYARILHPMYDADFAPVSWAEVAATTGRVLHPTAQAWRLAGRSDVHAGRTSEEPAAGEWPGDDPAEGSLPASELRALSGVLGRHTAGALVAAFWEGSGWEGGMQLVAWLSDDPDATPPPPRRAPDDLAPEVLRGPKLELPHRAYVLFRGATVDLEALADGRATADVDPFRPGWRTPNLLWPDDHDWCLATEVDLDSTVVGGSRYLVDDLLVAPDLEVVEVAETDSLGWFDDEINVP